MAFQFPPPPPPPPPPPQSIVRSPFSPACRRGQFAPPRDIRDRNNERSQRAPIRGIGGKSRFSHERPKTMQIGSRRKENYRSLQPLDRQRSHHAPPSQPQFQSAQKDIRASSNQHDSFPELPHISSATSLPSAPSVERYWNRSPNQLGLTPSSTGVLDKSSEGSDTESQDSAGDLDFEGDSAPSLSSGLKVVFKGKTSVLQTPADLSQWLKERKENFPTKARISAKFKGDAPLNEASSSLPADTKSSNKQRPHSYANPAIDDCRQNLPSICDTHSDKRKQSSFAAQIRDVNWYEQTDKWTNEREGSDHLMDTRPPDRSSPDSDDYTSSSGSSTCSVGSSRPTEATSKTPVPPPQHSAIAQRICSAYAHNGRCKFGKKCRYSHGKIRQTSTKNVNKMARGKQSLAPASSKLTLHARLLQQQDSEKDELALAAIAHLGERGLLDQTMGFP